MRVLFASGGLSGPGLEKAVGERLKRQEKMRVSSRTRYTQILTEGALRWRFGSRELMLEQAEHLAAAARAETGPRVRIGLIPWTVSTNLVPLTSFDLYDSSTAVVGSSFGTAFMDRPQDVAVYVEQLEQLEQLAVFGLEAAVELERIARDNRSHSE